MRHKVAVVMGGFSEEREISLISGKVVHDSIDKNLFEAYLVDINRDSWQVIIDNDRIEIDKNDFSFNLNGEKIKFDLVFNAIHGSPGEDGKLSAYLELVGLKQNSCDFFESALTFSKRECIAVAKSHGVNCAKSVYLEKGNKFSDKEIVEKLGLPLMVKPNRSGSSFGISKVDKLEDLNKAIENAFSVDHQILIEEFIAGTEVTVGVIPYKGEIIVLPMTEIVAHGSFFDYEAKYLGKSDEITPARIDEATRDKVAKVALNLYKSLNLKGLTRAEYIIKDGNPYFIEVNTIPGMTKASILPQQAKAAGIELGELFTESLKTLL